MILPSNNLLNYIPGVAFDYRFQYLTAGVDSVPVNLTGYTASWVVTDVNGNIETYGMGVAGGHGVFFGGTSDNLDNGIIDLILLPIDTTNLLGPASYQFYLTPPSGTEFPLLYGNIINANTELYIGNPPPYQVINGGNASTTYTNMISGGPA